MALTRVVLMAFVGGVGAIHMLPMPPASWSLGAMLAALAVTAIVVRKLRGRFAINGGPPFHFPPPTIIFQLSSVAVAALLGMLYGTLRVEHRLADALDPVNEDKVTRVVLRVAELPRLGHQSRGFTAEVLSSVPEGVPSRIQVRWNAGRYSGPYGPRPNDQPSEFPDILPGQVWRMALVLRSPHGSRNPHGFDYEGHVFAQGIRATGTVRGTPVLLRDEPWASLSVVAQRARHYVRAAMLPHIQELRWGGVLLALAIGDQASVASGDWTTFNRSGLTHLVSISGSHVTLIAVFAGMATNALWRRVQWRGHRPAEYVPAQLAAGWVALVVAWLYCLLAGWGVPARRTFVMLCVLASSLALRLPLAPTHVLAIAAVAVVLMDPWAVMASGFWLSFLAVYVLMATTGWWGSPLSGESLRSRSTLWAKLRTAAVLQLFVTLALLPPLAMMFNEVSLVSPFANAYAIPIMGTLVTPLALTLAGAALLPYAIAAWVADWIAWLAHGLLVVCMVPTEWLAGLRWASLPVAAAPTWMMLVAMVGVCIALQPRGLPFRGLGWAFMLPALFWLPTRPAPGDWDLYALDVGQGSALVLVTGRHTLVFDTGVRYSPDTDAAQRSLLPFLRALGIGKIDVLVVSHADLDHVGGLRSVLEAMPVEQAFASFDIERWLGRESRMLGVAGLPPMPRTMQLCRYGMGWRVQGVRIDFLWPLGDGHIDLSASSRDRNRNACVLHVKGEAHSLLLPGDIGADEEKALVDRGLGVVDVVVAAHHGSRFSSAPVFVEATEAFYVIVQAGRWNRYGHPAPAVTRRWQSDGAEFLNTAFGGAILARSRGGTLIVQAERDRAPRYWATPYCASCPDGR